MLDTVLQIAGGSFYLLAKVGFFFSELPRLKLKKDRLMLLAWLSYCLGLPFIIVLFAVSRNWIAVFLEAAAGPAMILGVINSWKSQSRSYEWIDWFVRLMIPLGVALSFVDNHGIRTINQVLEIAMVIGFLAGTWFLARRHNTGYLWFLLMNGSCALLMYRQHRTVMVVQQIISALFVLGAYIGSRSGQTKQPNLS